MSQTVWHINGNEMQVVLSGDFIRFDDADLLYAVLEDAPVRHVLLSGKDIGRWDSSLLLILFEVDRLCQKKHIELKVSDFPKGVYQMERLIKEVPERKNEKSPEKEDWLTGFGAFGLDTFQKIRRGWCFSVLNLKALGRLIFSRTAMRRVDFWFALQECGPRAVGIVSLISFMVGLILAFVGAVQLKTFGAQVYVSSLVTIAMIRIMGAVMSGIIMAGRTGASFAATIGTMNANEEIDALKTMGIPTEDFLVLPRLTALVICMPLLTMWADLTGMFGGAVVGVLGLGIPLSEYIKYSLQAWSMQNFWVGMFHGFIFGFIISLCGCYYGLNAGRDADGVGRATTGAVVASIVWMILATGFITLIFERLGI